MYHQNHYSANQANFGGRGHQKQFQSPNYDNYEYEEREGCSSPTAQWIYDISSDAIQSCLSSHEPVRSQQTMAASTPKRSTARPSNGMKPTRSTTLSSSTPRSVTGDYVDDDDDDDKSAEILSRVAQRRKHQRNAISPDSSLSTATVRTHQSDTSGNQKLNRNTSRGKGSLSYEASGGDPRITAPNVDKLSPLSVVEVRLQSTSECVIVYCSIDVLKM